MSSFCLTHAQGRKRCTDKLPVGAPGFGPASVHLSYICLFFPTHMCSTESVDEGLSFSSGGLWSKTMVSVLARQNPLERMISKRDTGGDVGAAVESGGLGAQRGLHPCCKTPTGADLIS